MAFNKKEEFSAKEQSLAAFAKAISHPARIAILKCAGTKRMNVSVVRSLRSYRLRKAP